MCILSMQQHGRSSCWPLLCADILLSIARHIIVYNRLMQQPIGICAKYNSAVSVSTRLHIDACCLVSYGIKTNAMPLLPSLERLYRMFCTFVLAMNTGQVPHLWPRAVC